MKPLLLVATSKGLIIYTKDKEKWILKNIHFQGLPVTLVYEDRRNSTWWVGIAHRHWGQKLHYSTDQGKSWKTTKTPKYPTNAYLSSGKKATLRKIWIMEQAGTDRPNGLWLGTEPGGLFYSDDAGKSFQLVEGLWNHESRINENEWFGAGKDTPFIHSIVIDPRDSDHVYVAVSCAGVFETKDGGLTWNARNSGLVATYLPNPNVTIGHDPHRLLLCEHFPDVLWQQNHCGIFRSENAGQSWQLLSDPTTIPHYGFSLVIDNKNPNKAWVIPAKSDEERIAADLALAVYYTKDAGENWAALRNGLPQQNCFDIVFRHAFCKANHFMAFGSTNGNVYLSEDEGQTWNCLSNHLARVESLTFVNF